MSQEQTAINQRVVIEEAGRLTSAGYQGDAARFVEGLLLRAISGGYRPVEPSPPLRGPGADPAVIAQAKQAAADAVRESKVKGGRL